MHFLPQFNKNRVSLFDHLSSVQRTKRKLKWDLKSSQTEKKKQFMIRNRLTFYSVAMKITSVKFPNLKKTLLQKQEKKI